jgi:Type IV secretion system pilin
MIYLQKIKLSTVFSVATGLTIVGSSVRTLAATTAATAAEVCSADRDASFLGLPAWYKYVVGPDKCVDVDDPKKLWLIGLAVLEILMRVAVYIALVMVVWGAWKIMSSQGEPEKISAGRKTIQNGLIGLAVTIVATVVINYAGGQF